MDWYARWKEAADRVGFDITAVEPVHMDIGLVGRPERMAELEPLIWVQRSKLAQGSLEIHKSILRDGRIAVGDRMHKVGAEKTLKYLSEIIRKPTKESPSRELVGLLMFASLKEFRGAYMADWRWQSWEFQDSLIQWVTSEFWSDRGQPFPWEWHRASSSLGPNMSFLNCEDFLVETGACDQKSLGRPPTFEEMANIFVRGHKYVFDHFALVVPHYQEYAPVEIEADLKEWWQAHQAEREADTARLRAAREAELAAEASREEERDRKRRALLSSAERDLEFPQLDWKAVTPEQLQNLIDEAPITKLAVMFSVTDVAIRKRAKLWGLTMKPQGYWLRPPSKRGK